MNKNSGWGRPWGRMTAWTVLLFCGLLCIAGRVSGAEYGAVLGASAPNPARVYQGKPGPWGQIEYTRIAISPPSENVQATTESVFTHGNWVFAGMHRHQVEGLFKRAHLNPDQLSTLLTDTSWQVFPGAVLVHPKRDLILSLSPESRQAIYGVLSRIPDNFAQIEPFVFHPGQIGECFEGSGISDARIAAFKKLLYGSGRVLLFADADPFMATFTTHEERIAFMRCITRRFTLLAKLIMTPESNVEEVARYWDFTGRHKELHPLLESLARVPGGTKIDLAHMMPGFARKRIYTFPPPHSGDGMEAKRNCHWSALNFFNDAVDDRFCDPMFIQNTVLQEYDRLTTGPYQFGDLMVLIDQQGDSIHSAVYLADDIVYTKNGAGPTQPWLYMHLGEVFDVYAFDESLRNTLDLLVFRRKNLAGVGLVTGTAEK